MTDILCDEKGAIMLDNEYTYYVSEDGLEFIIHFCNVLDFTSDELHFDTDYKGNPLLLDLGLDFVVL